MAKSYAGKALMGLSLLALPWGALAGDLGETIAKQGNGKGAQACTTCHGADGSGNPAAGFPRLAGMDADYLAKQLKDFQSKARDNSIMDPMAKALKPKEIKAVAEYYGSMPAPAATDPRHGTSQKELARGKSIAQRGQWDKNIPACTSCHGPAARGVGDTFPALAGQHASYITNQIKAWKSGKRSNDPNRLMDVVAERLSEADAEAVAAYLASLPAAKPQK